MSSAIGKFKRLSNRILSHFGLTLVSDWEIGTFRAARHYRKLFDHARIDLVLDVGANRGQYRDFLREAVGYAGDIISFEPIPGLVDDMRRKAIDDKHWRIEGFALGQREESASFKVMKDSVFSSFLRPIETTTDQFKKSNVVVEHVDVLVRNLDNYLNDYGLNLSQRAAFLKLDTQGFDLNVLLGAADSLAQFKCIQTEASLRAIYDGMPTFEEIKSFLENRDFVISEMFPVDSGQFPVMVEFDCIYINKSAVSKSA